MRLTYDLAYLGFQEKTAQVETLRLTDQLNVDVAPDGTIYGIEMLNAKPQLGAEECGKLVIVNEALAERQEIPLTGLNAPANTSPPR